MLFLLSGCSDKAKMQSRGVSTPAPVLVGAAERRPVPLTLDAIGIVEPSRTVSIRSQVTGTLQSIHFQEGQDVHAGDLLFAIDPRSFQNALQLAEADLQKARVQFETAHAQAERYRALAAEAVVSSEELQSFADAARAAAAQVQVGEAAAANARLLLDYCSIRAPIDGRTGSFGAHEGDLVNSGSSSPLVVIHQLSPTYVTFSVPQQYLGELDRYRAAGAVEVSATPPGANATPERGALVFIDNAVDPTTGMVKLKAAFPNESHRLWPAQFVPTRMTLATPEALVVPSSAIQNDQQGQHVFVVRSDQTAEFRAVTVERTEGAFSVVSQGLAAGEVVVTDGQLRVTPGKPVQVKTSAAAPAAVPAAARRQPIAP